jgi:aminoglycoside phosphotransferase (APT) family kinase protein
MDKPQINPSIEGINEPNVVAWLESHVQGFVAPASFSQISGGLSNLTYRITDAAGTVYVLRRPPLGHLLATAHDVEREYRVIAALQRSGVPVPPVLGCCGDPTVNGAPFFIMAFVDGIIFPQSLDSTATLPPSISQAIEGSMVDVLAALHALDPDAIGLGDLGRRDGFVNRQLRRWYRQFNDSKTRDIPVIDEVHDRLTKLLPTQIGSTIVHGDYRLGNVIVSTAGAVNAVLDWELCALGDPLVDLGWFIASRNLHATGLLPIGQSQKGLLSVSEIIERYRGASGREVLDIDFYVAFSYWRYACILEGVYERYRRGAIGDVDDAMSTNYMKLVDACADAALEVLAQ